MPTILSSVIVIVHVGTFGTVVRLTGCEDDGCIPTTRKCSQVLVERIVLEWCTKYRYKIFVTTQMRQLWPRSRARILLNELPHVQRLYRGKRRRNPWKFIASVGYITLEKAKNTLRPRQKRATNSRHLGLRFAKVWGINGVHEVFYRLLVFLVIVNRTGYGKGIGALGRT